MPANNDGVRVDPRAWNRADGFSPGQQITVRIPGLDTQAAFEESGIVPVTDIARSRDERQPVVLIDARSGRRQLIWAEIDSAAPASQRALLIHPAKNLVEGRRYVVALRRLRTAGGRRIRPNAAFRALRDRTAGAPRGRRASMRRVFRPLARAGIARRELVLAWDFTVASWQSTLMPMVHIRDKAFLELSDFDLRDQVVEGRSPAFTIARDDVMPPTEPEIARVVEGTITVPCFLRNPGCAVGKGFNRDADGLPAQKPGNTYAASFRCAIPRDLPAGGARALLYGQGTPVAPTTNTPPREGQDPHEFPRRTPESREMKDQFLRIGGRLQTPPCGGGVCHSNGYADLRRAPAPAPRRAPAPAPAPARSGGPARSAARRGRRRRRPRSR